MGCCKSSLQNTTNRQQYFKLDGVYDSTVPVPYGRGTLSEAYGLCVCLKLYTAKITELEMTDCIVNFVYKGAIYGRMGIMEAVGDPVRQEYDTNRLQIQKEGDAVMTAAGHLPYKAIFHVHVFKQPAKFKDSIYRVLRLADKEGMRSIAFPALECSTPANKEHVDSYLQMFYEFEKRGKPNCLHMIDLITSNDEDHDYHDSQMTKLGADVPVKQGISLSYGSCVRLNLHKDKITIKLKNTDCIVNFVYKEDIYGRMGIMEAAGDPVRQEYDTNRLQQELPHTQYGIVMTAAGNLPYKAIFHVQVFQQPAKFKDSIYRVLRLAEKEEMRSIAFPALECTEFVDGYLQVFYEFEKKSNPICLHMIDIIASSKEDYDYHDSQMGKMGEHLNVVNVRLDEGNIL